MSYESINIRFKKTELTGALEQIVQGPNCKNIAKIILEGLCDTDYKVELLTKALLGVEYKLNFREGQEVLIRYDNTATWRHNKDKTLAAYAIKDGYIKGKVLEVYPYRQSPYLVEYVYKNETNNDEVDTYDMMEYSLQPLDDLEIGLDD